ncbi:hypothetical protein C2S53_007031 [Perilla frutescens var. hirtella]|uniref:Uncharacterized protein n=1 Tax=Perilla frutescens var. hirtella TaxID=608512 RepID=A0AAD4J1E9_PERFH|nr:hypothetical protein C2S53_007031 [Perilla frutescens var. hirtella]
MSGSGTSRTRTKSIKGGNGQCRDPTWKYSVEIEKGVNKPYKYFKYNFYSKDIKGGVKRVKDHLAHNRNNVAPCLKVPEKVKEKIKKYMNDFEQTKHMVQQNMKEQVDSGSYYHVNHGGSDGTKEMMSSSRGFRGPIDRFMVNIGDDEVNGIPFNVIRIPLWINMCRSIAEFGRGLKEPSMYEMRTWILDEEVKTTTTIVDEIKDISIDASDCVKDATKLFELLDGIVEEVREDIVVQVVTDNASAYKAAGRMLMDKRKKLYWTECAWAKKDEGKAMRKIIMQELFWSGVVYAIRTTRPLVQVLRLVDGETLTMGFIYGAMDEAKEKIAKNLDGEVASYKEIWDIIDQKWEKQLHLVWWDYIGDEVPELKLFAMKILGLTCSSSACERNWSTFNQVHIKRRNHLITSRLNKLVCIMYNKKLKHKFLKKRSRKDEDDSLIVEEVSFDDEWVANPNDEEDMAIDVAEKTIEMMEGEDETSNKKRKTNEASIPLKKG